MSKNRNAKKRDKDEDWIIEELESAGHKVMQLDKFDLLVKNGKTGGLVMLEIKSLHGRLTISQEKMLMDGWPLRIARTPSEAIDAVEREEFEA